MDTNQAPPAQPRIVVTARRSHSSCSMIIEGTYVDGVTREEVTKAVAGTFGGRYQHFGAGKFSYIAYTD